MSWKSLDIDRSIVSYDDLTRGDVLYSHWDHEKMESPNPVYSKYQEFLEAVREIGLEEQLNELYVPKNRNFDSPHVQINRYIYIYMGDGKTAKIDNAIEEGENGVLLDKEEMVALNGSDEFRIAFSTVIDDEEE